MLGMDDAEARENLQQARHVYEDALAAEKRAREQFHATIAEVQRDTSLRMAELVTLTGYNREHLRRIARSAGVAR